MTDLDTSWTRGFRHILLGWTPGAEPGHAWETMSPGWHGWWLFTYVFVEMTNKMEVVCFRVTITSSTDFRKDCPIGKTTVSGSQTLYCNTQWKCLGEVT